MSDGRAIRKPILIDELTRKRLALDTSQSLKHEDAIGACESGYAENPSCSCAMCC